MLRLTNYHIFNRFKLNMTSIRGKKTMNPFDVARKTWPVELALQHFDNFYANVYAKHWKSLRLGLLCPNKYCAVVNIFGDRDDTEIELRQLGAMDMRLYYERHWKRFERYNRRMKILEEKKKKKIAYLAEQAGVNVEDIDADNIDVSDVSDRDLGSDLSAMTSEAEDFVEMMSEKSEGDVFVRHASSSIDLEDYVPVTELKYQEEVISEKSYYEFYEADSQTPFETIRENKLEFPDILRVYTFPRGNVSNFPPPKSSKGLGLLNYYLLDGASLLPVLALGIQPKDFVADFCAAPGGKSLMMLLTMRPMHLLCNDKSISRSVRMKSIFKAYIPDLKELRHIVTHSNEDARRLVKPDSYERILIDAPCTNDRLSVNENDNNMFKLSRMHERINMPSDQMDILFAGLTSLRLNGTLVYSTCSLSPIQNDGVVHMTLKKIWEETDYEFAIVDMKEAFRPLRGLFRMYHKFKYGTQILPFVPSNYGPMYISKFKRIK